MSEQDGPRGQVPRARDQALRVGLTGNIGSGKSTVAGLLKDLGAPVIDWDDLSRLATRDPDVLAQIASELGEELVEGGQLDRPATARLVFSDSSARRTLEGIVHPWVRRRAEDIEEELLASLPKASPSTGTGPVIVHDLPLLFESRREGEFDVVVVVSAPAPVRRERVSARSGLDRQEFERRDATQMPLEEKEARADIVVRNAGDLAELHRRVDELWRNLLERARHR